MKLSQVIKKNIINLISVFYLIFRTVLRILFFIKKKYVIIFYYHSIPYSHIERFVWQIEFLSKYGEIVSPDDVSNHDYSKHKFIITFDDGLKSVIKNALPELQKRNFPSIVFIPSNYIGKKPDWGKFITLDTHKENVIDNEELISLNSRVMEIGSHGTSHVRLSRLNKENLMNELSDSKEKLENLLDYEIRYLSVPYGDYDSTVINMAKKVGYKYLFCTDPGYCTFDDREYVKKRIEVETSDSKFEFIMKVFGGYNWRPAIIKLKKIIISTYKSQIKSLINSKSLIFIMKIIL